MHYHIQPNRIVLLFYCMFLLKLKEYRAKKGLSQKKLAAILNVSTGTVGNWEAGTREPDFTMTMRIADFFGISLDELLGRDAEGDGRLRKTVSAEEAELLEAFRQIGKDYGPEAQKSICDIVKLAAKRKR